ncbi:MAG: hypothetical protein NTV19_11710 [Burkholderiales bacterium]|nr:hypothetical protein [Burkholderiales bacterium]
MRLAHQHLDGGLMGPCHIAAQENRQQHQQQHQLDEQQGLRVRIESHRRTARDLQAGHQESDRCHTRQIGEAQPRAIDKGGEHDRHGEDQQMHRLHRLQGSAEQGAADQHAGQKDSAHRLIREPSGETAQGQQEDRDPHAQHQCFAAGRQTEPVGEQGGRQRQQPEQAQHLAHQVAGLAFGQVTADQRQAVIQTPLFRFQPIPPTRQQV